MAGRASFACSQAQLCWLCYSNTSPWIQPGSSFAYLLMPPPQKKILCFLKWTFWNIFICHIWPKRCTSENQTFPLEYLELKTSLRGPVVMSLYQPWWFEPATFCARAANLPFTFDSGSFSSASFQNQTHRLNIHKIHFSMSFWIKVSDK